MLDYSLNITFKLQYNILWQYDIDHYDKLMNTKYWSSKPRASFVGIVFIYLYLLKGANVVGTELVWTEVSFARVPKRLLLGADVSFHEWLKCLGRGQSVISKRDWRGQSCKGPKLKGVEVSNPHTHIFIFVFCFWWGIVFGANWSWGEFKWCHVA